MLILQFAIIFLGLFGLHRGLRLEPFFPAALQGINLRVSHVNELPCHPGTGFLIGSVSVEDKGLVPGIILCPGPDRYLRILTNCALNL